jgi:hypothetical protein
VGRRKVLAAGGAVRGRQHHAVPRGHRHLAADRSAGAERWRGPRCDSWCSPELPVNTSARS